MSTNMKIKIVYRRSDLPILAMDHVSLQTVEDGTVMQLYQTIPPATDDTSIKDEDGEFLAERVVVARIKMSPLMVKNLAQLFGSQVPALHSVPPTKIIH